MSESPLPKKICTTALAFLTVIAFATSSSGQSTPKEADSISAFATLSSGQSAKAHSTETKKKKKPTPTPRLDLSAAATSVPPTTSENPAHQAQNPLTPLHSFINENDTNPSVGPLRRTQDVLLVEPVIPIRLTPAVVHEHIADREHPPKTAPDRLAGSLL